jgi:phage terminase large subunit-like protein
LATEGSFVTEFVQGHSRITRGPHAGELVQLLPFQRELIDDLFGLRGDGLRQHRQALVMMPRKNGKTFLVACLALYEAVTGEPGGEVYFVAGDRQQARRAFDEVKRMVQMDSELSDLFEVYRNHMEIESTGTVLRVLSSDAGLQQGLNPSFVVFDEVAVQPNADLWHAMTLGSGTRTQPMVVGISTPGYSKDSLLWRLYEHGRRVQAGEVDDETFYFRSWEADPGDDHTDPATWARANPAFGHFLREEDFASVVKKTPEAEFRRARLGQWTATEHAAFPSGAWEACDGEAGAMVAGSEIILAIDGTEARDSVVIVGCSLEETPHVFVVGAWQAPEHDSTWRVPMPDVKVAILKAYAQWDVRELVYDPFRWRALMRELEAEGVERLVEFPSNSVPRVVPAWQELADAVMERKLTHDGDQLLARHVGNLQIRTDRQGSRPYRDSHAPPCEGAWAAMLAYNRSQAADVPRGVDYWLS